MSDPTVIGPSGIRRFVGKYRIEGILGEGAMGMVYAGLDPDIERPVAIKTIHQHLINAAGSQDWLDRFAREARAAGRVLHPNLVTIFDFLQEDGVPFIVMERVRSITLEDRQLGPGGMALEEIHAIMSQILAGLSCIHGVGIVHRDMKPANVMLAEDGTVKLTDFGIARLTSMEATGAGMIGTPAYMAPEQLMGGEVDARADIYACGVLLYELLTGRKPYKGGGIEALFEALRSGQVTPPSELVAAIAPAMDRIVLKAMNVDPVRRFESAAEMRAALAEVLPDADRTGLINMTPAPRPAMQTGQSLASGLGPVSSSMLQRMSSQTLLEVEKHLTSSLGPMGRIIVRRAAERSSSPEEMIETVLREFSDTGEREQLRSLIRRALAGTTMGGTHGGTLGGTLGGGSLVSSGLAEEIVQQIADLLKPHLGPIARVVTVKAARDAPSAEILAETVAAHIQDKGEQAQFLSAVRRALGGAT
ncbi:serine/threonine-protein kinase [Roseibium suaedae]|uniref:non-specific serine/threonine protein kinase n=1 Tax=Roseibium suaedae TaxID=735517 RepID=A0A1M7P9J6_9HYPH|nr:serine/threonine-protein kinase [Roseibium suaedae]SHN13390.1 serine/threonine protein kinase [Roseibium suaedae]